MNQRQKKKREKSNEKIDQMIRNAYFAHLTEKTLEQEGREAPQEVLEEILEKSDKA